MKRASLMNAASMLPRKRVNSPVNSGAISSAWIANSAAAMSRSVGRRRIGAGLVCVMS
jgi:hypothetical protein